MKRKPVLNLHFGEMMDPLAVQLREQGFHFKDTDSARKMRNLVASALFLRWHGVLSDGAADKVLDKIHNKILDCIEPIEVPKKK